MRYAKAPSCRLLVSVVYPNSLPPACLLWNNYEMYFVPPALVHRNLDLSKFCIGQKDDVQQPPIYDLYAVINHYGGMIGGHYTAYARLPSDKNSQRSDVGRCSSSSFLSPKPLVMRNGALACSVQVVWVFFFF